MNAQSKKEALQGKWRRWIGDAALSKRLIVGIVFVIALAFFLHFREVRMETYDLGSTATQYSIAQVDFTFPDAEATAILRQEALRDVGAIYELNEQEVRQRRYEFEARLLKDKEWREELPHATFEELYRGVDALQAALLQMRFSGARTIQKMQDLKISTENYYPLIPGDDPTLLPKDFWQGIEDRIFAKEGYHPEATAYILNHFQSQEWKFQADLTEEQAVREKVEEGIPEKYTRVDAGTRIISPGEKIGKRQYEMLQAIKETLAEQNGPYAWLPWIGSFLLSLIFTAIAVFFFYINHPDVMRSFQKLTLLVTIVILTLIFAKGVEFALLHKVNQWAEFVRFPIFVPFASVLICVLVGSEVAWFATGFVAVVLAIGLAVDHSRFLVINLIGGLVAVMCAKNLHKRKEAFVIFGKTYLACFPVIIGFSLTHNITWSWSLTIDLISALAFLIVTSILVVGLLPLLESIFHVMTDMTLMEYMDPNNELLRRLSLEAPGTYQHCLVVGNLAEAAAQAIGRNGLFCRVATLYHDIGKLFNPHYFTENQLGGFNIHQLLTPIESTQVIIAHVPEGEALAKKHGLPQSFIDVIREHHGTTLVYYFYCKQVEQVGGDVSKVDEGNFRYPGPKPRGKESAIIMIADTIEAASRSLEDFNEESVTDLVDRLIIEKAEDGQFDECQLTFEELGVVKKTIIRTLLVARHMRVKYPTMPG